MKENNYYNKKVEELYKELNTNISGLTEEEASKRLEEYGENKLAERKKKSNLIIFLNFINSPPNFVIFILYLILKNNLMSLYIFWYILASAC